VIQLCRQKNLTKFGFVVDVSQSEDCSGKITELTESSGTIMSPGYYKGKYPNNADCRWRIKVKENMVGICEYFYLADFGCLCNLYKL